MNNNEAAKTRSAGFDIIKNSVDGMIYASGYSFMDESSSQADIDGRPFVLKIDPSTGYVLNSKVLPYTVQNSIGGFANHSQNGSICEIGNTGKMVFASTNTFINPPSISTTFFGVLVYSFDQNLNLNPSWTTNPILLNPNTPNKNSRTWEVNYHNGLNQILLGVFTDCSPCYFNSSSNPSLNSGENNGFVYRFDNNGSLASGVNPSPMGKIQAFDMRVGVIETSDGGFAAVSARRNINFVPPTLSELNPLGNCPQLTTYSNYNFNYSNGDYMSWDSDPLVVKFNSNGTTNWIWSEDIVPGRARQFTPGDFKRQECMYKISETVGGGLVISGNNSFNYDDNYMVKLNTDCFSKLSNFDYAIGPNSVKGTNAGAFNVPPGQIVTWNSSKKIFGNVLVSGTLIINGASTTIEFSDSSKTGFRSGIEINLGGKVIINDATLTSYQGCNEPGMWCGIIMNSNIQFNQNQTVPIGQPSIILNNAKIFNARRGILTGMYNNLASGGGIVKATNSTFKNCYIDVEFRPYNNTAFNTSLSDLSFFQECNFLADQLLNEKSFVNSTNFRIPTKTHVVLNSIKGVKFSGCTFKTDLTNLANVILTDDRGVGIKSFNSSFYVNDNCILATSNACAQFSGNAKFENLQSGIIASSSNILKNYTVDNTTFLNCFKGIQQSGVNYSSVKNNSFVVNAIVPPSEKACIKGINIGNPNQALLCYPAQYYLNQCDGFKHSNNVYKTLGSQNALGTVFNSCNGTSNTSYRNNYSSMYRGHQLQAGNTNLQVKCNVNATTKLNDIAVTSGFVTNQGACVTPVAPANNLFSHLGPPESDIKSVSNFQYNFKGTPSGGFQVPLYFSGSVGSFPCNLSAVAAFNYATDCPVEIGCSIPCNLAQISNLSNAIAQNNNLLAAAAAPSLIAIINTQSGGNVKNALLAKSPFLSNEVLLAFLNKTPRFSNGIIKNVVEANQPVTDPVWQVVVSLNLPNGIFNQLQNGQVGTNARQDLIDNTNLLLREKQSHINDALLLALNPNDSITDYAQVENIFRLDNTGEYYDDLVNLYFLTQQFTNAQAYIDSLNKKPENENLVSFLNLSKIAAQEGTWENLIKNSSINEQLYTYAFNVNSNGSALAQAIRNFYTEESLYDAIENFNDGGTGARITEPLSEIKNKSNANSDYVVYPNPFKNDLNIRYNLTEGEKVKMHLTEIGSGKVIASRELSSNEIEVKLNTENLVSGVYLICFIKEGEVPVYIKLINLK